MKARDRAAAIKLSTTSKSARDGAPAVRATAFVRAVTGGAVRFPGAFGLFDMLQV
jgi:hypothetical protein